MPVYEYKHVEQVNCPCGEIFEVEQSFSDEALKICPKCKTKVERLISRTFISTPTGDSKLKNLGFTKLVKRDKGVYENVTATDSESRYMEADKPETMPHLHKKISD